jgi:hypothetical protein
VTVNNTTQQAMTTPQHLFVGPEGDLYDTRKGFKTPLREKYSFTFSGIETASQFKATIRAGAYAWPGGYPLYFITKDGAALCFACARKEARQVFWDFLNDCSTGWHITGCAINYEEPDLTCDHCSKAIESAYGN